HREHGLERCPQPAQVSVDAARLDVEEKATILYRHAKAAALPRLALRVVRSRGVKIVAHPHFTPERINRFIQTRVRELGRNPGSLDALIDAELAEPTAAMRTSLHALGPDHRALLVALLDVPAGPVSERELAHAARRHAPHGLARAPGELVDRLTDHFLRLLPPHSVTPAHPRWRRPRVEELAADAAARQEFLHRCGIDGALLALSRGGGRSGERTRPLLVRDEDWDAVTERLYELVPDLADPELARVLTALEDGLWRDADGEVAALATVVLGRIADCWERGSSFASEALLLRWHQVSARLPEPPAWPDDVCMWAPPPVVVPPSAVTPRAFASLPSVAWRDSDDSIVARILADL